MSVLRSIEQAGFVVVRVVADNHATNRKLFSMLSNGSILPVVEYVIVFIEILLFCDVRSVLILHCDAPGIPSTQPGGCSFLSITAT